MALAESLKGRPAKYGRSSPEKRATRQREHRASLRRFLNSVKVSAGCADCGFNTHPTALDFDHVRPQDKSFCVSLCGPRAYRTVLSEVLKCEVRCRNCHSIKHAGERG